MKKTLILFWTRNKEEEQEDKIDVAEDRSSNCNPIAVGSNPNSWTTIGLIGTCSKLDWLPNVHVSTSLTTKNDEILNRAFRMKGKKRKGQIRSIRRPFFQLQPYQPFLSQQVSSSADCLAITPATVKGRVSSDLTDHWAHPQSVGLFL